MSLSAPPRKSERHGLSSALEMFCQLHRALRSLIVDPCRLKQQLQQAVQAPAGEGALAAAAVGSAPRSAAAPSPSPQDERQQQQYLRLPVESAKKLRWFDRHDVDMLMKASLPTAPGAAFLLLRGHAYDFGGRMQAGCPIAEDATFLHLQLHLREKQELFEANSALRQVLRRRGLADASLDAELAAINRQVDEMREQEQGVNQVLVLAAQVRMAIALGTAEECVDLSGVKHLISRRFCDHSLSMCWCLSKNRLELIAGCGRCIDALCRAEHRCLMHRRSQGPPTPFPFPRALFSRQR